MCLFKPRTVFKTSKKRQDRKCQRIRKPYPPPPPPPPPRFSADFPKIGLLQVQGGIIILFTRLIILGSSTPVYWKISLVKINLVLQKEQGIRHLYISHNEPRFPSFAKHTHPPPPPPPPAKFYITFVFHGHKSCPRDTENNACALEAGQTRCIMGDVHMVNITNFAVLLFFCYSVRC